jgi:hypothetical protein
MAAQQQRSLIPLGFFLRYLSTSTIEDLMQLERPLLQLAYVMALIA